MKARGKVVFEFHSFLTSISECDKWLGSCFGPICRWGRIVLPSECEDASALDTVNFKDGNFLYTFKDLSMRAVRH